MALLYAILAGAAACAVGAWWLGRGLRAEPDGPALTERIHSYRQRVAILVFVASVGVMLARIEIEPAVLPLALLIVFVNGYAAMAGGTSTRRALHGDTTGLGNALRTTFAFFGFWFAVLLVPYLVSGWIGAAAVFAVLVAWSRNFPRVALRLVGAAPLGDAELASRFDEILARADAPQPTVMVFGPEAGRFHNAFAFPSLGTPHVAFSRPLLKLLDADEATAIFAHEVAHLEDFDAPTLRRLRWQELALVATACFGLPLLLTIGTGAELFLWSWMFVVLVCLVHRLKGMQEKETKSDLRAVELCGDAEALVRGLTKLHATSHIPRRMAADAERIASHPSLARRIRDIESHAGAAPEPAEWREVFGDVALDAERITWTADGAEHSLTYPGLVELRLVGATELRAVDRDGKKLKFLVRTDDVARLQAALDRVDGKLAPAKALRKNQHLGLVLLGAVIAFAGLLAARDGVFPAGASLLLLATAVGALVTRTRPWFTALGAIALVAGAAAAWWTPYVLAVAVAGAVCLWQTRRGLPDGVPLRVMLYFLLFGVPYLLLTLSGGPLLLRLHVAATMWPSAFLLIVGAGAALWCLRRLPGTALVIVGLSFVPLASEAYLMHVARDGLAAQVAHAPVEEIPHIVLRETHLEGNYYGLEISPGGERIALQLVLRDSTKFIVSDFDGNQGALDAFAVQFVDDARLLVVAAVGHQIELQTRAAATPLKVLWRLPLPRLDTGGASLAVRNGRWRVVSGDRTVRLTGRVGSTEVERTEWRPPAGQRFVAAADRTLDVTHTPLRTLALSDGTKLATSTLWVAGAEPAPGQTDVLCLAYGPHRGRVWNIDLRAGSMTPLFAVGPNRGWRWDGDRLAIVEPAGLLVIDTAKRRGVRIPLATGMHEHLAVALGTDTVAVRRHGMVTLLALTAGKEASGR